MVELQVMGPVRSITEGLTTEIRSVKQRALVARLVHAAPVAVPFEQLVVDLWGPDAPDQTVKTLHVHMSGLRHLLGANVARTSGRSYGLGDLVTTDLERFEREARSGLAASEMNDDVAADALLRSCLGRWRGEAASDVEELPFVAELRQRTTEHRLTAIAAWASVLARRGNAEQVVGTLQQLAREYPFREPLRASLMLALAASGRQVEALAEYDRIRLALADEFGVDPGPDLRDAHARVLLNKPLVAPSVKRSEIRLGLPTPPAPIIGRSAELAELIGLCDNSATRLISVVGPAGVGKTRLCQELVSTRANSAAFVSLAAAQRAADVSAVVAAAVLVETTTDLPADAIAAAAARHPGPLVLVLDNAEHVLDSRDFMADLLARCPLLTIVTTTRVPLGLAGERRFPLDALGTRSIGGQLADSVALLLDRMHALTPAIIATPEDLINAHAVVHLCDGLPLAIEIAAARTDVYSLAELKSLLNQPLGILTLPDSHGERGSSVRASVLWSVDSLLPSVRVTLQACALFQGGFTLIALAAVVDRAEPQIADDIHVLIERSLLRATASQERRFDLLHVIREVVLETVPKAELTAMKDRHARYFRDLMGPVPDARQYPATYGQLEVLDTERANLRAAVRHASRRSPEVFTDLVISLVGPWTALGPISEIRDWLNHLRSIPAVSPARRLDTLTQLLRLTERSGEPPPPEIVSEARTLAEQADPGRQMQLIAMLAIQALNRHDTNEMAQLSARLDQLGHVEQTPSNRYLASTALGYIAYDDGDAASAAKHLRRARRACVDGGLDILYLTASHNLSEALMMSGDLRAAADVTLEALARTNIADGDLRGGLLSNHGTALLLLGVYPAAAAALMSAVTALRDSGSTRHALEALMRFAAARVSEDPVDVLAARLTGVYLEAMSELGIRGQMSETLVLQKYLADVTGAPDNSVMGIARRAGENLVADVGPVGALDAVLKSLQSAQAGA